MFSAGSHALIHQKLTWIFLLAMMAIVGWSTFTNERNRDLPMFVRFLSAAITAGLCAGIGMAGGIVLTGAQAFLRNDTGVLGEHTLEITDDGLVESTEVNRSLSNWRTRFRIQKIRRYAFIYISATNVYAVPRYRAPFEGSVDEFLAALQERIQRQQQNDPENGSRVH
ncbi:MAG: hypothetical protein U1G08_12320 [Verrucomicrobiota bacterium]